MRKRTAPDGSEEQFLCGFGVVFACFVCVIFLFFSLSSAPVCFRLWSDVVLVLAVFIRICSI